MQRRKTYYNSEDFEDFPINKYNYNYNNNDLMLIDPKRQQQQQKFKPKTTTIIIYTVPVLLCIATCFILVAYWMFDGYHLYITSQSETESKLLQANLTWNEFSCDILHDKLEENLPNFNEEQIETLKKKYGKQVITSPENKQKCDNAKILLDEGYTYIFWKTFIFSMFYGPCAKLLSILQTPLTYFISCAGTIASVGTVLSIINNFFPFTKLFMFGNFNNNGALNV